MRKCNSSSSSSTCSSNEIEVLLVEFIYAVEGGVGHYGVQPVGHGNAGGGERRWVGGGLKVVGRRCVVVGRWLRVSIRLGGEGGGRGERERGEGERRR